MNTPLLCGGGCSLGEEEVRISALTAHHYPQPGGEGLAWEGQLGKERGGGCGETSRGRRLCNHTLLRFRTKVHGCCLAYQYKVSVGVVRHRALQWLLQTDVLRLAFLDRVLGRRNGDGVGL